MYILVVAGVHAMNILRAESLSSYHVGPISYCTNVRVCMTYCESFVGIFPETFKLILMLTLPVGLNILSSK